MLASSITVHFFRNLLSFFLFTLVADCLRIMVNRAREGKLLEILRVGREKHETDDTIFYLSFQRIVESFCIFLFSGLKINSIEGRVERLAEILGCG